MKIQCTQKGALSPDGIRIVSFSQGEQLSVGDYGFTAKNLSRMIELGFAIEYKEQQQEQPVTKSAVEGQKQQLEEEANYEAIDNKEDLEEYAREKFSIELDKRRSLRNMFKDLELKLKELDNGWK